MSRGRPAGPTADYVYVRDGQAEGHVAIGKIVAMEGSIATRYCRNPDGYGTWAKCNFDWAESGLKSGSWRLLGEPQNVTPPPREWGGFSLGRLGFATDQPGP
ncbi:hypothetical protein GCM10018966_075920 [Streptomyces yanii]